MEKYHEPKFLRKERRITEERLQTAMRNIESRQPIQPEGFQPQKRRNEQWTVDPFWEVDRPQRKQLQQEDEPGPSSRQAHTPMEEGEIDSETHQDPSVLEVPAVNWTKYVGVKSVQYIKMGHVPKVDAEQPNDAATPNDGNDRRPKSPKKLFSLERQQLENIPDDFSLYRKKLFTRYGLVFLRRPDNCVKEPENNGHQPLAQGTPGHKQNVNGGKTLLEATDYRSHAEEMRKLCTLQNVR